MAHQFYGYAFAGIFSLLTITHILAMLGTGVVADYLITMAFNFWFFPLIHMVGAVFVIMAYDNAYTVSQDTTSSYQATALSLMTSIQNQATTLAVIETARYLI